jgi:transcriptional regulator with XRE-family HTH domain
MMEPTKTKPAKRGGATLSLAEIADLRAKGVSLEKIGRLAGVSKQAISQLIKRNGLDPEDVAVFKRDKSLLLHSKQKLLLDSLTQEEIKKMSGRDKVVSFGIVYDKTRLEDDKSTTNIASYANIDISQCANNSVPTPIYAWEHPHPIGKYPICRQGSCVLCNETHAKVILDKTGDDLTPVNPRLPEGAAGE